MFEKSTEPYAISHAWRYYNIPKLQLYVLRQYCRPFKIRDSPLYLYLGKTVIRVFDLKSLVRMRPKHFSCKCTTKRNPIFVNWSCNARSGGDDHRQCFFVRGFRPSPLSHNSHNYFVQDEGRCLSYISLSWGLSFFHDFIIFPGKKGCSLFEIVSSLFLYFEWRHRWRQDLTDLVHPITQGNSLRASSPRGTEVGRGGGGVERNKCIAPQRPCIWGLPIKIL